jgi:hypothetical protein
MTGADIMTAFTPDAEARLEEYLRHVRAVLAAAPDVDPAEVEADVREHIDAEFADRRRPAGVAELEPVLARLGPPEEWAGGRPPGLKDRLAGGVRAARGWFRLAVRRVASALWHGPEDWRLAYLTFGLFALGLVVLPLFPALLIVSYLLSRAAAAAAAAHGADLGPRRWLVYPPLVLVSLALMLGVLAVPVVPAVGAGSFVDDGIRMTKMPDRLREFSRPPDPRRLAKAEEDAAYAAWVLEPIPGPEVTKPVVAGLVVGVTAAALWYGLLGALVWAFPRVPGAVFAPFLSWVEARHGRRVVAVCGVVLVVCLVLAYRYLAALELV